MRWPGYCSVMISRNDKIELIFFLPLNFTTENHPLFHLPSSKCNEIRLAETFFVLLDVTKIQFSSQFHFPNCLLNYSVQNRSFDSFIFSSENHRKKTTQCEFFSYLSRRLSEHLRSNVVHVVH